MKYIVFYRRNKSEQLVKKGMCNSEDNVEMTRIICDNEESLATTIQNLQIDPQTTCKYENKIEMSIYPYFEEGQMVLNIKTLQTRIIHYVVYEEGIMAVYNHDNPHEAELQKNGYMPIISETWNICDCVPVDFKKAREEHWFQFGTEMGVHPKYSEAQIREMESWF